MQKYKFKSKEGFVLFLIKILTFRKLFFLFLDLVYYRCSCFIPKYLTDYE